MSTTAASFSSISALSEEGDTGSAQESASRHELGATHDYNSIGHGSRYRIPVRRGLPALAVLGLALLGASPAKADLRLCNQTGSKVGISLGYRDPQGWVTEGWWDLAPKACETLLKGALAARFYYVFAVDYTRGGEWSGRSLMCTRDSEFTIRGTEDCLARGYDRNGFFEVDTGEQKSWTIQLTDPNRADTPQRP